MELRTSFDLEELPEAPRKGPSLRTISLWLVAAAMGVLFLPLYLISASVHGQARAMEARLKPLQGTLTKVKTPEPLVLDLMGTLAKVETSLKQIEAVKPTLAASHANWPAVMAAIGSYDSSQLVLLSLSQSGRELALKGRAASDAVVTTYAHTLERSGAFERVTVQSIKALSTPFATATATATSLPSPTLTSSPSPSPTPTIAPTATADLRDAFEPDDAQPRDIFLAQPQLHNFFPASDVDKVRFLAKAGRFYRVFTSDLAPGVDTLLTVNLGTTTLINDDEKPGVLRSELAFQVPPLADLMVIVEIKNRGSSGPDMSYRVTVEEYIPTPTPVPTPTSTPSPLPTSRPTPTPSRSATPPAARAVTSPAASAAGDALASSQTYVVAYHRVSGLASVMSVPLPATAQTESVEFVILLVVKAAPL